MGGTATLRLLPEVSTSYNLLALWRFSTPSFAASKFDKGGKAACSLSSNALYVMQPKAHSPLSTGAACIFKMCGSLIELRFDRLNDCKRWSAYLRTAPRKRLVLQSPLP
jgi:hypothetical protein